MLESLRRYIQSLRVGPIALDLAPTAPAGLTADRQARERNALLDTVRQVRDVAERHLADAQQRLTAADPSALETQEIANKIECVRRFIASLDHRTRELERTSS